MVGGLEHFFFHNTWDNPSHWLIFFRGLKPPTWLFRQWLYGFGPEDCWSTNIFRPKIVRRQIVLTISYAGQCGKASNLGMIWELFEIFWFTTQPQDWWRIIWLHGDHDFIHWFTGWFVEGCPMVAYPAKRHRYGKLTMNSYVMLNPRLSHQKYLCWWLHMSYTDIYSVGTSNI